MIQNGLQVGRDETLSGIDGDEPIAAIMREDEIGIQQRRVSRDEIRKGKGAGRARHVQGDSLQPCASQSLVILVRISAVALKKFTQQAPECNQRGIV